MRYTMTTPLHTKLGWWQGVLFGAAASLTITALVLPTPPVIGHNGLPCHATSR